MPKFRRGRGPATWRCSGSAVLAGDESESPDAGRPARSSLVVGLVVLVMDLLVAAVKYVLAAWH